MHRHLPELTGRDACLAAMALGTLRRRAGVQPPDLDLLPEMAGVFERAMLRGDETVTLTEVASFLSTCGQWRFRMPRSLLAGVRDWVTAAAGGGGAGAASQALGPPASAATLIRVWANHAEVRASSALALPMGAVEALTRSAAAGAGADERGGGFGGRKLSLTLYAAASLVRSAHQAARVSGRGQRMAGLDGDLARWAGLAIGRANPQEAQQAQDLGMSVWALNYLGVAPDAATAAAAGAQAAALAARLAPRQLLLLVATVAGPLAQWHEAGLAPCEAAARALCARAPAVLQEARPADTARMADLLRALAAATGVPAPALAEQGGTSMPKRGITRLRSASRSLCTQAAVCAPW